MLRDRKRGWARRPAPTTTGARAPRQARAGRARVQARDESIDSDIDSDSDSFRPVTVPVPRRARAGRARPCARRRPARRRPARRARRPPRGRARTPRRGRRPFMTHYVTSHHITSTSPTWRVYEHLGAADDVSRRGSNRRHTHTTSVIAPVLRMLGRVVPSPGGAADDVSRRGSNTHRTSRRRSLLPSHTSYLGMVHVVARRCIEWFAPSRGGADDQKQTRLSTRASHASSGRCGRGALRRARSRRATTPACRPCGRSASARAGPVEI